MPQQPKEGAAPAPKARKNWQKQKTIANNLLSPEEVLSL